MIVDGMKICYRHNYTSKLRSRIGQWIPVSEFGYDDRKPDKLKYACKGCISGANKRYVESIKGESQVTTLIGILNQATKNLTSTSKGYYTYD